MQTNDALRPLIEPLINETRTLMASEPGIEERVGILLRLARAQDTLGQTDVGKKTRAEAVALARSASPTDPSLSPMLWPSLAGAHDDAKDPVTAKALYAEGAQRAQKLKDPEARFFSLAWLALYQAHAKNTIAAKATMALAMKSAPAVGTGKNGRWMQNSLLMECGEFAAAKKQLLLTKGDLPNTILALGNLATKQAKAGDKAGAKATLTAAQAKLAGLKEAIERKMILGFLAGYSVQIGEPTTGKKLAGSDPRTRKSVAEALAEGGDTEGASAFCSEPLPALAYALARKGKIAEAQKEVERILADPGSVTMQDEPVRLLGALAAAQAKAGDTVGASATLEQARKRITDDKTFGDKRALLTSSLLESIVTGGKRDR